MARGVKVFIHAMYNTHTQTQTIDQIRFRSRVFQCERVVVCSFFSFCLICSFFVTFSVILLFIHFVQLSMVTLLYLQYVQ